MSQKFGGGENLSEQDKPVSARRAHYTGGVAATTPDAPGRCRIGSRECYRSSRAAGVQRRARSRDRPSGSTTPPGFGTAAGRQLTSFSGQDVADRLQGPADQRDHTGAQDLKDAQPEADEKQNGEDR